MMKACGDEKIKACGDEKIKACGDEMMKACGDEIFIAREACFHRKRSELSS